MTGYLIHSAKGTEWKDHKYISKDNGRYVYKTKAKTVDDVTGIHSPDFDAVGGAFDNVKAIKAVKDFLQTPIWSPNKEDKTLLSEAKARLDKLANKNKDVKMADISSNYNVAANKKK